MNLSDLNECPKCHKMEVVRILKVYGVCARCSKHEDFMDLSVIHTKTTTSKVYYAYQEALEPHRDKFITAEDGGVTAKSTLPPELNELAKMLAVKFQCRYYNDLDSDRFSYLINKLGGIQVIRYLDTMMQYKVMSKCERFYKQVNFLKDAK